MNDELINQLAVQVAQLRNEIDELRSQIEESSGDSMDDLFLRIGDTAPGGSGSHMGNTDDSEEIDGDVTFESADDSNVKVTTEKRTEGDEVKNVIKIGVYYI